MKGMASDSEAVRRASEDYLRFLRTILRPAAQEFEGRLFAKDLKLHHVFQTNVLTAHMIDYLITIRRAAGLNETRKQLVEAFDQNYAVEGAVYLNRKFQLVDAVNNALKHIALDWGRYPELIDKYGNIGFGCLREHEGVVLFEAENHHFDFARVVLRPVLEIATRWEFDEIEDVADFALGNYADADIADDFDDDPIDQMIDYCNPKCLDCGEGGDDCRCSEFVYAGERGDFRGDWDENFDFDSVMSRISGAYRPD